MSAFKDANARAAANNAALAEIVEDRKKARFSIDLGLLLHGHCHFGVVKYSDTGALFILIHEDYSVAGGVLPRDL